MAALLEKAGIKGGLVKELPRSINLRKPLPATLAAKVQQHATRSAGTNLARSSLAHSELYACVWSLAL